MSEDLIPTQQKFEFSLLEPPCVLVEAQLLHKTAPLAFEQNWSEIWAQHLKYLRQFPHTTHQTLTTRFPMTAGELALHYLRKKG